MKSRLLACWLGALVAAASCRQADWRTIRINVPGMHNAACKERILDAVSRVPGVDPKRIRTDEEGRVVEVTYDSLGLSLKNIEFAIADAGFAANDVPANAAAVERLPPECRPPPP